MVEQPDISTSAHAASSGHDSSELAGNAATTRSGEPTGAGSPHIAAAPESRFAKNRSRGVGDLPGLRTTMRDWMLLIPSWLSSMALHIIMLLILALLVLPVERRRDRNLVATTIDRQELSDALDEIRIEERPEELNVDISDLIRNQQLEADLDVSELDTAAVAEIDVRLNEIGIETFPKADLMSEVSGFSSGQGFEGRSAARRQGLVAEGGGSVESELAVARALVWLAKHQNRDGSWDFNHQKGPCQGRCANPGVAENCSAAATGLALLPFLGAGQTHLEGEYQKVVKSGVYYLVSRMQMTKHGGSLTSGTRPCGLYDQGIATIALCEAFAMTQDEALRKPAQHAIDFIASVQHSRGGGWRYEPGEPGDTSVLGWQMMALKSGHMAYLNIPPQTIQGVNYFLDSVQSNAGADYGYVVAGDRPAASATTAVGLLCRMYLGWDRDRPALQKGLAVLSRKGPSDYDMYYNYYTTQVMHHYGHEPWKRWNAQMRDLLIQTQSAGGHEEGSWFLRGGGINQVDHGYLLGGRLYFTSLACMTLEVYYRYLPLYQKQSTQDEFD